MKILHTIPSVLRASAGPSYSVMRLCDLLSQENKITLISTDETPVNFNHKYLKTFPISLGLDKLGHSPQMHRWISKTLERKEVDILHTHSLWMMQNIYPSWESKKFRIPIVISPRGTLANHAFKSGSKIKKLFWPLIQKPALKNTTVFHATSDAEKLDIRNLGFNQPIAVIPNGIDIPSETYCFRKAPKKILYLGRIHPIKGIDILLQSWKELQDIYLDWSLEIVGPDTYGYLNHLKNIHDELKLKRVVFSNEILGEEKNKKLQSASLFVLPSHSESFGVAVADALSNGVPCLVTKGAPWSSLDEKNAGWWVENSMDSLVFHLKKILKLDNLRLKEMGTAGRLWMEEDYNWGRIADMMLQTYKWILTKESKPNFVYLD